MDQKARPDSQAPSAGDSLLRALAAREQLLRELDNNASGTAPAAPQFVASEPSPQEPEGEPKPPQAEETQPPVDGDTSVQAQAGEEILRLEAERAELASRLEGSQAEVERLREVCAERERRIVVLESQLHETASANAQDEAVAAKLADLEETYRNLAATGEREKREYAEEVASLTRQLSELRQRHESQISEMTNEINRRADWPGERGPRIPGSNGNQPATAATPTPASHEAGRAESEDAGKPALLIVDDSEIGEDTERRLQKFGLPTIALRPGQNISAQVGTHSVVCMALNLGMPGTWRILRTLRNSVTTAETPMLAYVMVPRSQTGYWFGSLDFVTLPLAYNDLLTSLQRLTQPMKHVILIGMDEKLAGRVRKQLAPANVSVTVALDRRNALEAVRGKYPQAAVVYAAHNPVDSFRAIAGIHALAIFKDLPTVLLLDPAAVDREDERLSVGARTLLRLGALRPNELVDLLALAMNKFKPASNSG